MTHTQMHRQEKRLSLGFLAMGTFMPVMQQLVIVESLQNGIKKGFIE